MSDLHSLTEGSPRPRAAAPTNTGVGIGAPAECEAPGAAPGPEPSPISKPEMKGFLRGPARVLQGHPSLGGRRGWGCRSAFPQEHLPIADRGSARPELRQALLGTSSFWGRL